MGKTTAPLKYPGAKWSCASWITSHFPAHRFYIEPFFGSGAAFFNKAPSRFETINDIDGLVVNFFRACRDYPEQLARAINLTPFARDEYNAIREDQAGEDVILTGDCVEDARRFAVRCSQSFGSKLADRCGWKNTKHSSGPVNPLVWAKIPETVIELAQRLKNAQIENTDAVTLIRDCNAEDCLIYADPPYLGETRKSKRIYRHEMLISEMHEKLLRALLDHKGKVVISGYDNTLYNGMLKGWAKDTRESRANSAALRIETIWCNFDLKQKHSDQLDLFSVQLDKKKKNEGIGTE